MRANSELRCEPDLQFWEDHVYLHDFKEIIERHMDPDRSPTRADDWWPTEDEEFTHKGVTRNVRAFLQQVGLNPPFQPRFPHNWEDECSDGNVWGCGPLNTERLRQQDPNDGIRTFGSRPIVRRFEVAISMPGETVDDIGDRSIPEQWSSSFTGYITPNMGDTPNEARQTRTESFTNPDELEYGSREWLEDFMTDSSGAAQFTSVEVSDALDSAYRTVQDPVTGEAREEFVFADCLRLLPSDSSVGGDSVSWNSADWDACAGEAFDDSGGAARDSSGLLAVNTWLRNQGGQRAVDAQVDLRVRGVEIAGTDLDSAGLVTGDGIEKDFGMPEVPQWNQQSLNSLLGISGMEHRWYRTGGAEIGCLWGGMVYMDLEGSALAMEESAMERITELLGELADLHVAATTESQESARPSITERLGRRFNHTSRDLGCISDGVRAYLDRWDQEIITRTCFANTTILGNTQIVDHPTSTSPDQAGQSLNSEMCTESTRLVPMTERGDVPDDSCADDDPDTVAPGCNPISDSYTVCDPAGPPDDDGYATIMLGSSSTQSFSVNADCSETVSSAPNPGQDAACEGCQGAFQDAGCEEGSTGYRQDAWSCPPDGGQMRRVLDDACEVAGPGINPDGTVPGPVATCDPAAGDWLAGNCVFPLNGSRLEVLSCDNEQTRVEVDTGCDPAVCDGYWADALCELEGGLRSQVWQCTDHFLTTDTLPRSVVDASCLGPDPDGYWVDGACDQPLNGHRTVTWSADSSSTQSVYDAACDPDSGACAWEDASCALPRDGTRQQVWSCDSNLTRMRSDSSCAACGWEDLQCDPGPPNSMIADYWPRMAQVWSCDGTVTRTVPHADCGTFACSFWRRHRCIGETGYRLYSNVCHPSRTEERPDASCVPDSDRAGVAPVRGVGARAGAAVMARASVSGASRPAWLDSAQSAGVAGTSAAFGGVGVAGASSAFGGVAPGQSFSPGAGGSPAPPWMQARGADARARALEYAGQPTTSGDRRSGVRAMRDAVVLAEAGLANEFESGSRNPAGSPGSTLSAAFAPLGRSTERAALAGSVTGARAAVSGPSDGVWGAAARGGDVASGGWYGWTVDGEPCVSGTACAAAMSNALLSTGSFDIPSVFNCGGNVGFTGPFCLAQLMFRRYAVAAEIKQWAHTMQGWIAIGEYRAFIRAAAVSNSAPYMDWTAFSGSMANVGSENYLPAGGSVIPLNPMCVTPAFGNPLPLHGVVDQRSVRYGNENEFNVPGIWDDGGGCREPAVGVGGQRCLAAYRVARRCSRGGRRHAVDAAGPLGGREYRHLAPHVLRR